MNFNNERSTQYDWFKGSNQQKAKPKKDKLKDAWKWTKIFSYLSLFTFSMFGCVQIFTVGTDTNVGQGVELFNSADNAAPSVSQLNVDKIYDWKADLSTNANFREPMVPLSSEDDDQIKNKLNPVYVFSSQSNTNIWVNKYENPEELKNLKKFLKDSKQNVEVKDAYKGSVQSWKMNIDNSESANEFTVEVKKDDKHEKRKIKDDPLWKELVDRGNNHIQSEGDIKKLNDRKTIYWEGDENKVPVFSSAAKDYKSQLYLQDTMEFWVPVLKNYTEFSKKVDGKDEKFYKPEYGAVKVSLNKNQTGSDNKDANIRNAMAMDMIEYLRVLAPENNAFGFYFDSENAAKMWLDNGLYFYNNAYHNSRYLMLWGTENSSALNIMRYTGIRTTTEKVKTPKGNVSIVTELNQKAFPSAAGTKTSWRPITSWGEAWSLGPFYGLFVYPIAGTTNAMLNTFGMGSGWEAVGTIILIVFTIRILTFALSFKSTMQQQKMQSLNSKKAMIEAKYVQYAGNKQMEMRKRQEIAQMYKKAGINPMSTLGTVFLTMPFFLAIWRVIGGVPHLKAASWLGITFSATSWQMLFAGFWQYLPLMILAAGIQALSQFYPKWLNKKKDGQRLNTQQKEALKKANKTQNIMQYVMIFMSLIFSAGIQIYWIIGGIWRMIETKITHTIQKKKKESMIENRVKF